MILGEKEVRETLENKGYRSDNTYNGIGRRYKGTETIQRELIDVSIVIEDFNFAIRPKFFLINPHKKIKDFIPHLDAEGQFCYAASDTLILNKFDKGGAILLARKKFLEELDNSLSGKNYDDILSEFSSYWLGRYIHYDLADNFEGFARIYKKNDPSLQKPIISTKNRKGIAVYILKYDCKARLYSYNRDATDLLSVLTWCENIKPGSKQEIMEKLSKHSQSFPMIMMNGKHGMFGFTIEPHLALKKINRVKPLKIGLNRYASNIKIQKYSGTNISDNFVYTRSLVRRATLEHKKICIIGCGTVGSHIVKFSAQSGAGSGDGGELLLIDKQLHEASNIGRHLLGHNYINKNKAEALKEFIHSIHPDKNIKTSREDATGIFPRLQNYDLIIDATGDTVFSRSLNSYKFENKRSELYPDILFVWLKGLGAACQSFLVQGNEKACYQCLETDFGKDQRFEPLRNPNDDFFQPAKCGDGIYIPYSVASAAIAAGIALEMMLDWSKGNPKKRLRTRLIDTDPKVTKQVKDVSPDKIRKCPQCFPST